MEFTPKTRDQINEENQFPVWTAGVYPFEIARAEEAISSNGNPMIKLTLNIFNSDNNAQIVFDYLMAAMPEKLLDACEATGLIEQYNAGKIEAYHLEGKTGSLRLAVKPKSKNKDTGKEYPERNEVKTYIASPGLQSSGIDGHPTFEESPFEGL